MRREEERGMEGGGREGREMDVRGYGEWENRE